MTPSRGCAAALAASAVLALGVQPASAAPQDVEVLTFTGVASGAFPPLQLNTPSTGTYSFHGQCIVFAEVGVAEPVTAAPSGCSITSSGTFTNILCPTGTVTGTATVTEAQGGTATYTYTVVFVAGIGVLEGTINDDGRTGTAAGVLVLVPLDGNCVTTAVSQFEVTGAVTAVY